MKKYILDYVAIVIYLCIIAIQFVWSISDYFSTGILNNTYLLVIIIVLILFSTQVISVIIRKNSNNKINIDDMTEEELKALKKNITEKLKEEKKN